MTQLMNLFAALFAAPVAEPVQAPTKCHVCNCQWSAAQCTSAWTRAEWEQGATCEPCVSKFFEGLEGQTA
jgi:hypothetical protein